MGNLECCSKREPKIPQDSPNKPLCKTQAVQAGPESGGLGSEPNGPIDLEKYLVPTSEQGAEKASKVRPQLECDEVETPQDVDLEQDLMQYNIIKTLQVLQSSTPTSGNYSTVSRSQVFKNVIDDFSQISKPEISDPAGGSSFQDKKTEIKKFRKTIHKEEVIVVKDASSSSNNEFSYMKEFVQAPMEFE